MQRKIIFVVNASLILLIGIGLQYLFLIHILGHSISSVFLFENYTTMDWVIQIIYFIFIISAGVNFGIKQSKQKNPLELEKQPE